MIAAPVPSSAFASKVKNSPWNLAKPVTVCEPAVPASNSCNQQLSTPALYRSYSVAITGALRCSRFFSVPFRVVFHRNRMLALRNLNIGRCVAHKTAVDIDISTRRIGTQRRRSNFQGNPPVTTLSEFFLEALGRRCYVLRCGEVKPK